MSQYHDTRSDFFRGYFEQGLPYTEYVATGTPVQREKWMRYLEQLELPEDDHHKVNGFIRRMNLLVLSGIWCGDCARQGPMLRQLSLAQPMLAVRFVESRQHPPLQEELRINGAEKVPVVVVLSEDFFELARFGDRHLSVYRRKVRTEAGAACDVGFGTPALELEEELHEWVAFLERLQHMLRLAPMLRTRYND